MTQELNFITIAEAAEMLAAKKLSPVELVQAKLKHIEALNPQLDAFVTLTAELALEQARKAESEIASGRYRGPLHGVPFGLKDIYNTAGILTSGHSKVFQENIPDEDATTTARLYDAGAILLGKLSTHEFAHGGPSFDLPWPPARNPWNPEHMTGGSSSGSGAAVAAGFMPGALGSDTGGSIRNPAAFCGLVGLKPTYGLVSRYGVIANSYTFDHAGPLTWTVEDCALMLQVLAGHDQKDPASANHRAPDYRAALTGDVRGLRIGLVRHFYEQDVPANDETQAAMAEACRVFESLGAKISDVRLRPMQDYYDVKITIAEAELYSVHEHNLRERPGDFGADFLGRVLVACLIRAQDYVQAQRERRVMLAEMESIYEQYDVLLTAAPYGPAPRFDQHRTISFWQKPSIATPFNVTGGPALVQCMGYSGGGLPLCLQLVGRPFDEPTVLRAAHAYEQATPWRERRPNLQPGAPKATNTAPAPDKADLDAVGRERIAEAARRSGLQLPEEHFEQLCAAAPYMEEMVGRLARKRDWREEPGNTFHLPGA
ncbi:MAG: amidase [SAR324 cluster bacterium]|nr:amidase [SAR324 cluster bacterium]